MKFSTTKRVKLAAVCTNCRIRSPVIGYKLCIDCQDKKITRTSIGRPTVDKFLAQGCSQCSVGKAKLRKKRKNLLPESLLIRYTPQSVIEMLNDYDRVCDPCWKAKDHV